MPRNAPIQPLGFSLSVTGATTHPVVRVGGELDVHSALQLRDELLARTDHKPTEVVLDLTDLTFVDSTGLGVIVSMLKRLRHDGGDLRVRGARTSVRKVFELTGVSDMLKADDWHFDQRPASL